MPSFPKLSIITVNLNNANGLQKTINSVINQTWKDFEFIIIDGGSVDDSVNIIKENDQCINYWVSENDKGIYNAMNNGIRIAQGEYLFMLNSGDFLLADNVLEKIFASNPQFDLIYADLLWDKDGHISERRHPPKLSFQYFREEFLSHQSTFIRRALHDIVGLYDETLKIVSDWKFMMLAVCRFNASYSHIPIFASQFDRNGTSCDGSNWPIVLAEKKKVFEEEFPSYVSDYQKFDKLKKELDTYNKMIYIRAWKRFKKVFGNPKISYVSHTIK